MARLTEQRAAEILVQTDADLMSIIDDQRDLIKRRSSIEQQDGHARAALTNCVSADRPRVAFLVPEQPDRVVVVMRSGTGEVRVLVVPVATSNA